jgi:uncharacterized protein YwqG
MGISMNKNIKALGRKCLRLISSAKPKSSFFGGKPKVGRDIVWPRNKGKPLGFIAQLDLSEINSSQNVEWLPTHGRLLFFYDLDEWPWGFDPKDHGGWAVIYEDGSPDLIEKALPPDLDKEHFFPTPKYVEAIEFTSYPDVQRIDFDEIGMSNSDENSYFEFIESIFGDSPRHQIDGYPSPIQNDSMEDECQLVTGGVYCGNSDGYSSQKAKDLRSQANDWKLLLQFDSDDDVGMWGDSGMLYFWVKESEAKKQNFSNAWMILQCC